MMGSISAGADLLPTVRKAARRLGVHASPDDCSLCLRGMRTLAARLDAHSAAADRLVEAVADHPLVRRVLRPGLGTVVNDALVARDFSGGNGLLTLELEPCDEAALGRLIDPMKLFALGYSWGGVESLILPVDPAPLRSARAWDGDGTYLRLHAGLESPDALSEEIRAGLERLRRAA